MSNVVDTLWGKYDKLFSLQKYHEKYLFSAVDTRNIHKIQKILESGVKVNYKRDGFSLLFYAVTHLKNIEDIEIIKLILKYGADVNVISHMGTPLTWAIIYLKDRIVELLLTYGADINLIDDIGATAMNYMTETILLMNDNERILPNTVGKIMNHMLEFGACINNYIIIVYIAIQRNDEAFLRMLLDYGADINLTCNMYPNIPLEYSIRIESDVCTNILLLHIIELKRSKKHVNRENLKCLEANKKRCKELMNMKKELVLPEKSYVSLYDLLSKSLHQIMKYLRNEDIKQALKTTNFIKKYPQYFDVLSYRVTKSIEKNKLFDDGHQILQPILDEVCIPLGECSLKIMSYLNYSDLKRLVTPE